MQQKNPQADAVLKAIQEREKDHLLQLGICNTLAQITDRKGLITVVQQLKDIIGFDVFTICITNEHEKEYNVFFHDNDKAQSELLGAVHPVEDGYFDAALQSAEPITFNLINPKPTKNGLPVFIKRERQLAMREVIAMPLPYQKSNPAVLFLFFKNARGFTSPVHRLLKNISIQLSLTVTNIVLTQKIARYGNSLIAKPQLLSDQNIEPETTVTEDDYSGIVGQGAAMQQVVSLIKQVAPSDSGVLLLGESGTGKEVIATVIHKNSARRSNEMVRVNCAAIPANLIESELFGHEKGSFTGAVQRRIGKFEQAHNGTLFLDEIGELPLAMQTKLLRVLQEQEFERIGSSKTIKVNVRIIAATNRNLQEEVAAGRFRADLYYRLNVFPILLPPLRDRKEDIPELSAYFVAEFCRIAKRKTLTVSAKVLDAMAIYPWPGNVRELQHTIERTVLLTMGTTITEIHLAKNIPLNKESIDIQEIKTLEDVEKEHILKVIKLCAGKISGPNGAAAKLGLPNTTLISKMQKLGIIKTHAVK